jgi:hypothetical protein
VTGRERDPFLNAARSRLGLSERALELLVVLDVRSEVAIDAALAEAFAELRQRGLAEGKARLELVRDEASARPCAVLTSSGRAVMHSLREIVALEGMERILTRRRAARAQRPAKKPSPPRVAPSPLTRDDEQAILDDALAWVDATPTQPTPHGGRVTHPVGPPRRRADHAPDRPPLRARVLGVQRAERCGLDPALRRARDRADLPRQELAPGRRADFAACRRARARSREEEPIMSTRARRGALVGVDLAAADRLRAALIRMCDRALRPHVRLTASATALLVELYLWDDVRLETAAERDALVELERHGLAGVLSVQHDDLIARATTRGCDLMIEVGVWTTLDSVRRSLSKGLRKGQRDFDSMDRSERSFFARAVVEGLRRGRFVDGEPITDRDISLALSFFRDRDEPARVRALREELRDRRARKREASEGDR